MGREDATPALHREQAPGKASPSAMSNAGEEGDVPLPARLLGTWGGNASLSKEGSTDSPPPSLKKKALLKALLKLWIQGQRVSDTLLMNPAWQ